MADTSAIQKKFHRNESLDGFRGLGCLIVMLGHTQRTVGPIFPGALVAMDLFFVLSGFLIGGLLLAELRKTGTISLGQFWKRRAIRLLPAFYVYFCFIAVVFGISRFRPIVGDDPKVSLLSTAFYASNWAVARGYELGVFFVTWSLSLEEQFYLLCPIVFLVLFRFFDKKAVMAILAASVIGVNLHRYSLYHHLVAREGVLLAFKEVFYRLDTRCDALLIGCLGSIFYNLYGERIKIPHWLAVPVLFALLGPIFLVRDVPVAFHRSETSPFTELMVAGGFTVFSFLGLLCNLHLVQFPHSLLSRFFASRALVRVGIMSYSIYLWHTTVFGGIDILLRSFNRSWELWVLKTLVRFSVALLVGYASFRWVELPVLEYLFRKRKFASIPETDRATAG